MLASRTKAHLSGPIYLLLTFLLLTIFLGLDSLSARIVQAEDFVNPAFQQQWQSTDAAVKSGQVARTYFWGPQPFAHTGEVYKESADNSLRQVQYFDKARMELSKRPGLPPDYVTNGLLTEELVTGQMQVGDNTFLTREPSRTPVAGDPIGNVNTPSYASFGQGRLAFGSRGAVAAADRTGQTVLEAVDGNGSISKLEQVPKEVKDARYFSETGHNLADVFNAFFQAAPLNENSWLPIMGYPISEPLWIKDKALVGRQYKEVLVQLFQRRVLTYTPSNPPGWQVEMGNIGQHYYVWRYGFNVRDQLPGQYRLVVPEGQNLLSNSLRGNDSKWLGSAPANISGLWTTTQSSAIVSTGGDLYLADLRSARPFLALPLPAGLAYPKVREVALSSDSRVAVSLTDSRIKENEYSYVPEKSAIQVYRLPALPADNRALLESYSAYSGLSVTASQLKLSANGRYLAFLDGGPLNDQPFWLNLFDLDKRTNQRIKLFEHGDNVRLDWIGQTEQLIVSTGYYAQVVLDKSTVIDGQIVQVDAASGTIKKLLQLAPMVDASVSPDGHYLAVLAEKGYDSQGTFNGELTLRELANPTVPIVPSYLQGTAGRYSYQATLEGWSQDGSYLVVKSTASRIAGIGARDYGLVSLATGKAIQKFSDQGYYSTATTLRPENPFYILKASNQYNGPDAPTLQTFSTENQDGSDRVTLFSFQNNETALLLARIVQVPLC
ncbi:MAG TPA: hypothetical protein VH186_17270 [Chloroflexia bacterium]|nr:hypothetical protein [Chloroflexia bacterium]